jgi:ribonuclease HI
MSHAEITTSNNNTRNASIRVPGKQTNNRAELFAILYCLTVSSPLRTLLIRPDSQYAIRSIFDWGPVHSASGWQCENGDILSHIAAWIRFRQAPIHFNYVPGHSGNEHGDAADALAKEGARKSLASAPPLCLPHLSMLRVL